MENSNFHNPNVWQVPGIVPVTSAWVKQDGDPIGGRSRGSSVGLMSLIVAAKVIHPSHLIPPPGISYDTMFHIIHMCRKMHYSLLLSTSFSWRGRSCCGNAVGDVVAYRVSKALESYRI